MRYPIKEQVQEFVPFSVTIHIESPTEAVHLAERLSTVDRAAPTSMAYPLQRLSDELRSRGQA